MRPTLGDRVYRWLLVAYPSHVRHEAGDEMTRGFRDERTARAGRVWSLIALWLRAALDVLVCGTLERLAVSATVSTSARPLRGPLMQTAHPQVNPPGMLDGTTNCGAFAPTRGSRSWPPSRLRSASARRARSSAS
jgi:hypothetical protein